ncbi:YdeI/OmpD-associated family protein [Sinomonas susongensis]|uniref:YdeI/OmpD-associated family protein n=1 Tax=Sinomonas susongensis TaxID=1324851 RepID=UPI001109917B|nr:YdeI/OmpD-associated family protein [Sinomonas susongensis]
MAPELPELLLPDADAWRAWLEENHATSPGVWLVQHKKGGSVTELTFGQALDHALCFGWVDGQIGRRDEGSYVTRFTPRGPKSRWSRLNVANVERLESAGLMTEAGRAVVQAAKKDGRWEQAYAGQASAEVPDDLAAAIAANPAAQELFEQLTAVNRYALIYRTGSVKKPETRARKIAEFVDMLARGETIHPQKRRSPKN